MELELYLIEILHQTTTSALFRLLVAGCILSKFYIKPQLLLICSSTRRSCILSKFYIKPQLDCGVKPWSSVVSYRNSTSNHNGDVPLYSYWVLYLIEILHQTTTAKLEESSWLRLYLIEILHQTTTGDRQCRRCRWLYLIEILHQTTTVVGSYIEAEKLYLIEILHQTTTCERTQRSALLLYLIEILHQTTTLETFFASKIELYLIEILHQTTTSLSPPSAFVSCILSKFYIKPQQGRRKRVQTAVVSYRNSTSNHNPA